MFPKLTLPQKRSRSSQGHHFSKLWWAGVPDSTYQVLWKSTHQFWRRFLKGFYHIWAWQPSIWCDQDPVNKLPFPLAIKAPHKISTWSAKRFQKRRSLKLWTPTDGRRMPDGRTDAGAWVYYKLTCEPAFSSGELKIGIPRHTPVFLYKSGVTGGIHCTDMSFFFFDSV